MPPMMPYLLAGTVGAFVGSFLNVCIHRLPRHESVVWPASHCPSCAAPIAPYDNVPLVSYLLLRGRCRACRAPIAWRYPLIESINGVGYGVILWWFGADWPAAVYALFFSALLVITCIDLTHRIIPDAITLPGIAVGLVCAATILPIGLLDSVLGLGLGGGLLWGLAWVSPYLFGKEGMGGGDIKLLAMIGAFLGWKPTVLTILVGAVVGSVVGVGLILCKVLRRDQYLPFGPFLALGAVVALLFHREVLTWYLGFLMGPP
ncbi:MAG: prepilin peptidase [Nitrospira sp.]|nr:prepilin peptidase [Nitrospira sp.]